MLIKNTASFIYTWLRTAIVLSQDFIAVDIIDRSCARRLQSASARSGVSLPNDRDDSLASA